MLQKEQSEFSFNKDINKNLVAEYRLNGTVFRILCCSAE